MEQYCFRAWLRVQIIIISLFFAHIVSLRSQGIISANGVADLEFRATTSEVFAILSGTASVHNNYHEAPKTQRDLLANKDWVLSKIKQEGEKDSTYREIFSKIVSEEMRLSKEVTLGDSIKSMLQKDIMSDSSLAPYIDMVADYLMKAAAEESKTLAEAYKKRKREVAKSKSTFDPNYDIRLKPLSRYTAQVQGNLQDSLPSVQEHITKEGIQIWRVTKLYKLGQKYAYPCKQRRKQGVEAKSYELLFYNDSLFRINIAFSGLNYLKEQTYYALKQISNEFRNNLKSSSDSININSFGILNTDLNDQDTEPILIAPDEYYYYDDVSISKDDRFTVNTDGDDYGYRKEDRGCLFAIEGNGESLYIFGYFCQNGIQAGGTRGGIILEKK